MTTRRVLLQELIQDAEGRKESARQQMVTEDHLIKVLREQLAAAPLTEATTEPAKQSRMIDGNMSLPEIMAVVMRENRAISTPQEIVAALESKGITSTAKRGLLANVFSALGRRTDLFKRLGRGHYAAIATNGEPGVK